MNKKLILFIMVTLLLLGTTGCNKDITPDETGKIDIIGQSDPTEELILDGVPGVENVDAPVIRPSNDETTETTSPTTGGSEDPEETIPPTTGGNENPGETTSPNIHDFETTSYEKYLAMGPEEQLAFFNTFDSMEDFVAWYNAAKAEYEALHPGIDIGDGNIDIGDIIGGGN